MAVELDPELLVRDNDAFIYEIELLQSEDGPAVSLDGISFEAILETVDGSVRLVDVSSGAGIEEVAGEDGVIRITVAAASIHALAAPLADNTELVVEITAVSAAGRDVIAVGRGWLVKGLGEPA